jgi:hypothetical protein
MVIFWQLKFSNMQHGNHSYSRPGSVIATFHIEINDSSPVTFVRNELINAIGVNETLGAFPVNSGLLKVGKFTPGEFYILMRSVIKMANHFCCSLFPMRLFEKLPIATQCKNKDSIIPGLSVEPESRIA